MVICALNIIYPTLSVLIEPQILWAHDCILSASFLALPAGWTVNMMAGTGAAIFSFEVEAGAEDGRLTREKEHGFPIPIANKSALGCLCLNGYER